MMDVNPLVELPTLVYGDSQVRYLVITKDGSEHIVTPHTDWNKYQLTSLPAGCLPLFIAADMWEFLGGNSGSNNTRFLNKMQSLGLSTKLKVEGLRIEGIHNNKLLHCFTVQAMYMALFNDFVNGPRRRALAMGLWDLWIKYGNINDLPSDMHYKPGQSLVKFELPLVESCSNREEATHDTPILDRLIEKIGKLQPCESDYLTTLRSLMKSYKSIKNMYGDCGLQTVLELHQQLTQGILSPPETPSDITNLQSLTLESTARCLAKSFSHMHSQVKEQTNKFKRENIQSVDSLPSAQEMCSSLFPRPMVVFFEDWLNVTHTDLTLCHGRPPSKRKKPTTQDSSNIYPFIQLMLEFANNTLISGVAHVLFTRLIMDQPGSSLSV